MTQSTKDTWLVVAAIITAFGAIGSAITQVVSTIDTTK